MAEGTRFARIEAELRDEHEQRIAFQEQCLSFQQCSEAFQAQVDS